MIKCKSCGWDFDPRSVDVRYCSPECRKKGPPEKKAKPVKTFKPARPIKPAKPKKIIYCKRPACGSSVFISGTYCSSRCENLHNKYIKAVKRERVQAEQRRLREHVARLNKDPVQAYLCGLTKRQNSVD